MKRLFTTLLVLFLIYFVMQVIMNRFGGGHETTYQVTNNTKTFDISEKYINNKKDEQDNYYIEINVDDKIFNMQIFEDFFGAESIIKKIYYYSNNEYTCILPRFIGEKYIIDLLCIKDSIIYPYHNIKGWNNLVDDFARSLKSEGYLSTDYDDDITSPDIDGYTTSYVDNVYKDHFISINNYRGIYVLNSYKLKDLKLFNADTYRRPLSAVVGKYYIAADYNSKYSFDEFVMVDLTSYGISKIKVGYDIDFDSYIQGVFGKTLYLFDRSNKKQYEITPHNSDITLSGNVETGIKYYTNGEMTRVSAYDAANNDYVFETVLSSSDEDYYRIDKVGKLLSGYFYYYEKVGNIYKVYRANVQNTEIKTYLFQTNKITDIKYVDDFVYYTSGIEIKYYQDKLGNRTIFKNNEFDFNANLYFNVYGR